MISLTSSCIWFGTILSLLLSLLLPNETLASDRRLQDDGQVLEGWLLPPYPTSRYRQYSTLDAATRQQVTDILEYNETTWNIPETNELEYLSLETIADASEDSFNVITETLSINEETWDCYINHFWDYFWSELEAEDLTEYFEILGWTQETWDDESEDGVEPETEEMFWGNLTALQQQAAEYICYFPDLWNGLEIGEWTTSPGPTIAPVTVAPSAAATTAAPVAPSPTPDVEPTLPQRKVAPPQKCGSLAGTRGRGGAAAEAKDCVGRRKLDGGKRRLKGRK